MYYLICLLWHYGNHPHKSLEVCLCWGCVILIRLLFLIISNLKVVIVVAPVVPHGLCWSRSSAWVQKIRMESKVKSRERNVTVLTLTKPSGWRSIRVMEDKFLWAQMWPVHLDFYFLQGHKADGGTEKTGGVINQFCSWLLSDITPQKQSFHTEEGDKPQPQIHWELISIHKQTVEQPPEGHV